MEIRENILVDTNCTAKILSGYDYLYCTANTKLMKQFLERLYVAFRRDHILEKCHQLDIFLVKHKQLNHVFNISHSTLPIVML